MTNYEIWQAVLAEFELKLTKANFNTWFSKTGISKYDDNGVLICVPSAFIKSWIEKKYHTELIKILERVTGRPVKKIDYKVDNIKNIEEKECQINKEPPIITNNKPAVNVNLNNNHNPLQNSVSFNANYNTPNTSNTQVSRFGLNPKYTFSTFIVGKGNELAHAAAQAVASRPGDAYNPLFVYGGVGLGKTHLLQAIAHAMLEKNPKIKVLYVSSEKFTNEFVVSVKEGRAKEFKDRYRNVDLLLIDDIQFIAGKEQTQEEFFHTFNELHQQSKQVVLTSDRPPRAIPALEDRLRSRFEWGMIVDISAPDLETRTAILQAKAQEKKFFLPQELAQVIALNIQSNIRELEGALNKIIAFHELKGIEPTKESIKSILSTFESQFAKKSITPKDVLNTISKFYDINMDEILGKSREKKISFPRQIIMFLLREDLKMSYPAIGEELGGRDHTTAMHAHSKIISDIENDLKLKQEVEAIRQRLYTESV